MNADAFIIPFAKKSGCTSFSSLNAIKKAYETKKVGHSGTLDKFADGVMIALVGQGTRLSSFFLASDKRYTACFVFGIETETLDPEGAIMRTGKLPRLDRFNSVLPCFVGQIQQAPPAYSSIHIAGKRASDRARSGEKLELKPRPISIYELRILSMETIVGDDNEKYVRTAILDIACSKGTYIRSLCRDIAYASGSVGFVSALRRTAIGDFLLDTCAAADELEPFTHIAEKHTKAILEQCQTNDDGKFFCTSDSERIAKPLTKELLTKEAILKSALSFTRDMALRLGLFVCEIKHEFLKAFVSGQRIRSFWFSDMCIERKNKAAENATDLEKKYYAVFYGTRFCGIIEILGFRFSYQFVLPVFTA